MDYRFADSLIFEKRILSNVLDTCFEGNGSSTFFTSIDEENEEVTYAQFKKKVDIMAANMLSIGISKGKHVAVLMETSTDYLTVWFALAKIGAVEVPINTVLKGETLQYLINDCDAEYIFLDEKMYDAFDKISSGLKNIKYVILHGQNDYPYENNWGLVYWNELTKYNETLLKILSEEINKNPVQVSDPVGITYTARIELLASLSLSS